MAIISDFPAGGSKGLDEIIENYNVEAGETINAGDFVKFINGYYRSDILNSEYTFCDGGAIHYTCTLMLSDTKILSVYADEVNNNYGTAQILTISGDTITAGTKVVFNSGGTEYISLVKLSDTKILVAYKDSGNNNYGTAQILTISGDTITAGTEVVFNSGGTEYISLVKLSDTRVLAVYQDAGNNYSGNTQILTISEDIITASVEVVFTTNIYEITSVKLSDTKVLVVYGDANNNFYGAGRILTISGDTTTSSPQTVFNSIGIQSISLIMLSDTKVLVTYSADGSHGDAQILTISGDNITAGTEVVFNSGTTSDISSYILSDTKILVTYRDYANTSYGTAQILTISGDSITAGTEFIFCSAITFSISMTRLSDTKVLVAYAYHDNEAYGRARILHLNTNYSNISMYLEIESVVASPCFCSFDANGIAKTGGSGSDSIEVYTKSEEDVIFPIVKNGVIESYQVDADENIAINDCVKIVNGYTIVEHDSFIETRFNSAVTPAYSPIIKLSDTKILVAYKDSGNNNYGTAQILTISGDTITAGTEVVFNSSDTDYISLAMMSDTQILVAYQDAGSTYRGTAQILTISGDTITAGTEVTFSTASSSYPTTYISAIKISDTTVLVTYLLKSSSYNRGTARILTISNTTITLGTAVTFASVCTEIGNSIKLSDNRVYLSYMNNNSSGCAIILKLSGTTISVGVYNRFNLKLKSNASSIKLSDSKILVVYRNGSASSEVGTAQILTISDITTDWDGITAGTKVTFNSGYNYDLSVTKVSDTKALLVYADGGNNNYGTAQILTISGDDTITVGNKIAFTNNEVWCGYSYILSDTKAIVSYGDYNNSCGTIVTLRINDNIITPNEYIPTDFVSLSSINENFYGIAKTAGTSGESIDIYVKSDSCHSHNFDDMVVEYPIAAGKNIVAGDLVKLINGYTIVEHETLNETIFNNTTIGSLSLVKLSDSKTLLVYTDGGNNNYGTACILTISGNIITVGSKLVFSSNNINYTSAVKLSDTKVLVGYADQSNSGYGTSVILTIDNDNITSNTSLVFNSSSTYDISVFKSSDNTAMVVYLNGSTRGTIKMLIISDTTITVGTGTVFTDATYYVSHMTARMINNNKIIVLLQRNNGSTYYGIAIILTIDNDTVTVGTPMTFNNAISQDMSGAVLSDSSVLIVYRNGSNNSGIAQLLSINDTTITSGSTVVFSSTATIDAHISTVLISTNRALVSYYDGSTNGTAVILNIDNSSISVGNIYTFWAGVSYNISSVKLSDTKVLVGYNNNIHGAIVILGTDGTIITPNEYTPKDFISPALSGDKIFGFARSTGNSGENIPVETLKIYEDTSLYI